MRIRFSENYTVKAEGGETYLKGKVYDLSPRSAQHFMNKMIAAEVKNGKSEVPETASVAPSETASVAPSETAVRPRGRPRTVTSGDG
ncbi:hypothetical protein LCGC14_0863940 [marine sediment metagenome]|uniref:Uncharacterized protein n=1 Tax=marine sediment metagenome TaxID=412755 RepID=A0A0F9P6K8_9ZZZZ